MLMCEYLVTKQGDSLAKLMILRKFLTVPLKTHVLANGYYDLV
jgi:hypothetical protein